MAAFPTIPSITEAPINPQTGRLNPNWYKYFINWDRINRTVGKALSTQTDSYTLQLEDAGAIVEMDVASSNTLTIPPNTDVPFPVATIINGVQIGAGQTTIVAGTGVTLHSESSKVKIAHQYSWFSLYQRATDEWVLGGSLAT